MVNVPDLTTSSRVYLAGAGIEADRSNAMTTNGIISGKRKAYIYIGTLHCFKYGHNKSFPSKCTQTQTRIVAFHVIICGYNNKTLQPLITGLFV